MKKSALFCVMILGLVGALAVVPAFADNVLYNNTGPGSYKTNGWGVNQEITDSFTLSQNSTITGATLGVWLYSGDSLQNVTWAITAIPNQAIVDANTCCESPGPSLASGTSPVLSSTPEGSLYGYSLEQVLISIPALELNAGTYWFEIDGAYTAINGVLGTAWDESDGPSVAYGGDIGLMAGSETFQILGEPAGPIVTPEPSSFLLLGSGLAGLAGFVKRKLLA